MSKLTHFHPLDRQQNTKMYNLYHNDYHWLDGWNTGTKERNFQHLMHLPELTGIPMSGATCLDVGCGTGDLSLFLRKRGIKSYLGIDIYEPSLKRAREKYPFETFLDADILANEVRGKYDYVFCSGALTVKLKTVDNYDFLEAMVRKIWQMSKIGIAFNFLTEDPDPDPDLFFYKPDKVLEICKKIAPKAKTEYLKDEDREQGHFYLWRLSSEL